MTAAAEILPANEAQRIAAVRRYEILDTPADGEFDRITALAARRLKVPIAIISIVDEERIWFKSHHGVDVTQIGRDPGLCASAILGSGPYILNDAKTDPRALANPLVAGDFGLRFYAGVPLTTSDGYNLGTLCVLDKEPRPVSQEQIDDLSDLASIVMDQLEFRLSARRALSEASTSLKRAGLLSREIDHRVMNSLQFVVSLLQIQRRTATNGDADRQLELAAGRVAAVARVHRHFHLEQDAGKASCLTYLKGLCSELSNILEIPIMVEGDTALLPTISIQPIGLIVNELVTNAAKHGGGKVLVTFTSQDICEVAVYDEGDGVPGGFDPATGKSGLGMTVVNALAQQLHGQLSIRANPSGKGACFAVTFPKPDQAIS